MCEYSPGCTIVTDPLAKLLSEAPREASAKVLVYCPTRYHLLAAVYEISERGGLVLCLPRMKARRGSIFQPVPGEDPGEVIHWHPAFRPIADFAPDESAYGRCRCGTWSYQPASAREVADRAQAGTWEGVSPNALVKVRDNATGRIFILGHDYVESWVLPQGGYAVIGGAPRSDRLRRPHILGSYVEVADAPKNRA